MMRGSSLQTSAGHEARRRRSAAMVGSRLRESRGEFGHRELAEECGGVWPDFAGGDDRIFCDLVRGERDDLVAARDPFG